MNTTNDKNVDRFKKLGKQISQYFTKTKVIFMFGSCSWEIPDAVGKESDLDLEIVIANYSLNLSESTHFGRLHGKILREGFEHAKNMNCDVILYRFDYKGVDVMLHFVPQKNFEKLMQVAIQNSLDGMYSFRELRNYLKQNPKYTCCSFTGKKKIVSTNCLEQDSKWYLIDLPLCVIENNLFYGGVFPEWHLTPPIVLAGNACWLNQWVEKLFDGYVEHLRLEEKRNKKGLKFTNVLERKYKIPSSLLQTIEEKVEQKLTFNNKKLNQ